MIIIGFKGSGKTTVGKTLSNNLNTPFVDLDDEIEKLHNENKTEKIGFREIFKKYGEEYFRRIESAALRKLDLTNTLVALGGGSLDKIENQRLIKGKVVYLKRSKIDLFDWIKNNPPAYLKDNPDEQLEKLYTSRTKIYERLATITIECDNKSFKDIAEEIGQDV